MNILAIYHQYSIPSNLQHHMLRVAAVGELICDRLKPDLVDQELVIKTLLLHDMGNIMKVNFDRVDLFDEEDRHKLDEYRKKQQEFAAKYSSDPDEVTLQIIKEATADTRISELCQSAHWSNLNRFLEGEYWAEKICTYSDMRVGPFGLLTITERINDLKHRRPEESPELDQLHKWGIEVEKQLLELTEQRLLEIDQTQVEAAVEKLKSNEV